MISKALQKRRLERAMRRRPRNRPRSEAYQFSLLVGDAVLRRPLKEGKYNRAFEKEPLSARVRRTITTLFGSAKRRYVAPIREKRR